MYPFAASTPVVIIIDTTVTSAAQTVCYTYFQERPAGPMLSALLVTAEYLGDYIHVLA
jgi:hypothetical protein